MSTSLTEMSTADLQKKRDTLRKLTGFVTGISIAAVATVVFLIATKPVSGTMIAVVTPLLVLFATLPQSYARVRAMDQELARRGVNSSN